MGGAEAGFLRRFLLVLLAAFALGEAPVGARELPLAERRAIAVLGEDRRFGDPEPYVTAYATDAAADAASEWHAAIGAAAVDGGDPTPAAPAAAQFFPRRGRNAAGMALAEAGIRLPPCKAIHSRAPPAFA